MALFYKIRYYQVATNILGELQQEHRQGEAWHQFLDTAENIVEEGTVEEDTVHKQPEAVQVVEHIEGVPDRMLVVQRAERKVTERLLAEHMVPEEDSQVVLAEKVLHR